MDKELPSWLDETFLAIVLQGGEDRDPQVSVTNFTARLAVAPGNNYLSHIFRVKVEYELDGELLKKTLMVKAPITKGIISNMSDRMDVFGKEIRVYKEFLVKVNEKLNEVISPTVFYCPIKALVLQDLNEDGYIMCDKHKQLDYAHCVQAVTTLAKFHAASVACNYETPELIKIIGEEQMFVESNPSFEEQFKPWLNICVKAVAGIVAEMDGCKQAAEYLLERAEHIGESIVNVCKPNTIGLNVLNHGDLWVNNMMFKYNDSGEVVDVKFLDFQITRYASPALDLIYFLWTSSSEEVRELSLKDLYRIYCETLNKTLGELGCEERLTEQQLLQDIRSKTDWILIAICNTLPMMQVESENVIDMEAINEEDLKVNENSQPDERFMKVYNGKHYLALLPTIMKQFYRLVSS